MHIDKCWCGDSRFLLLYLSVQFSQFSHSVVSNSLQPHELQHARPPCSSLSPGVHSDSCPSSPWCHPAISSSVVPFSSCPQSLPASEFFPMSQLFAWGGQSTGVSALADTLNSSLSSILYIQSTSNSYWFYLQTYTEICPHHSTSTA